MTGVAFILFSYYMISDPATTPFARRSQILFGFAVAGVYGLLVALHVAFGLFFALTTVSGARGLALYAWSFRRALSPAGIPAASQPASATAASSAAAAVRETA